MKKILEQILELTQHNYDKNDYAYRLSLIADLCSNALESSPLPQGGDLRERFEKKTGKRLKFSHLRTNHDTYAEYLESLIQSQVEVKERFQFPTDDDIGKIVQKIAYEQLHEEQCDDFIEKIWIVKNWLKALHILIPTKDGDK
jgi:hypothetical protein